MAAAKPRFGPSALAGDPEIRQWVPWRGPPREACRQILTACGRFVHAAGADGRGLLSRVSEERAPRPAGRWKARACRAQAGYPCAIAGSRYHVAMADPRHSEHSVTRRHSQPRDPARATWLQRVVRLRPGEGTRLRWAFLYSFSLLCSYYLLRPLRDEMGIRGGIGELHWVFTGTFFATLAAAPLFAAAAARFPRKTLLPVVYLFFFVNILLFFGLFRLEIAGTAVARAFFIWTSVYNLLVVSVFWSFMADLYSAAQAKRLFGLIAAGGTLGAIAGPALAATVATRWAPINLLPSSAALLLVCIACIVRLTQDMRPDNASEAPRGEPTDPGGAALGGSLMEGLALIARSRYLIGICLFIWLYTTLSTFVYFEQAHIVAASFADSAQRTRVFALLDLAVNLVTIGTQAFVTGRVMERFGVAATLALVPGLVALGFTALAVAPVLPVLLAFQTLRRSGNYALTKPAREVLFTVVDRSTKYKAKNFIDTVVYRGGDAVSAWLFAGLQALGLGLAGVAIIAFPLAGLWSWLGWRLGQLHARLAESA